MANYNPAKAKTLKYEGGISDNKNDSGKFTYKGIASAFWPDWKGWEIIEELKTKFGYPNNLESNQELQDLVSQFYYNNFWLKIGGDKLINDHIASEIFDTAVNNGIVPAIRMVQQALQTKITGKLDQNTINLLNELV